MRILEIRARVYQNDTQPPVEVPSELAGVAGESGQDRAGIFTEWRIVRLELPHEASRPIGGLLIDVAREVAAALLRPPGDESEKPTLPANAVPHWDPERSELRVGEHVVKRFRVPAHCQSRILAAFQEQGWPECIDDPLPPAGDRDARERLHDAVKALNRGQLARLIEFHGDGTGQGVRWKWEKNP